jgi:hypothetical protein
MTRLATYLLFIVVLWTSAVQAQVRATVAPEPSAPTTFAMRHHPVLDRNEAAVRKDLADHPEILASMKLAKKTAWNFTVGSAKTWYGDDLVNNTRYQVPSTCRAVGTNCYVFVENTSWTGGKVTQAAVDSVVANFNSRTPANPSQGIYATDVAAFGNPPDVDSDAKVIILILDILDGYDGSGGFVTGYFYSFNEVPSSTPGYSTSNQAEIFFIDCNPLQMGTAWGLLQGVSTLAHEFQHMIHFNYDPSELTFINEGCALLAEVNCGYPLYDQSGYVNETNMYLFNWRTGQDAVLNDYSRAARWTLYMRDQLGIGFFKQLVGSTQQGIAGVNAACAAVGTARRFPDMLSDWFFANILDDAAVNPKYAYASAGLPKAVGEPYLNPNVTGNGIIQNLAAQYLTFAGGENLSITFTVSNPAVTIKAVEIGTSSKRILDVTPGVAFTEPAFGTTYSIIHFVVMNTGENGPFSYSFTSSGTGALGLELAWDTTEPTGYLTGSPNDTVCVLFDGYNGAKLDSVRVALRRACTMTGGVWGFTGVTRPTPLGTKLAGPVTASIATTPSVPYPVPWPNWATVDLHTQNINASQPFAVAFVNTGGGTAAGDPRVMATPVKSTTAYYSFTYLNTPSGGGSPGWYYLSKTADSVWIYLIRAYISWTATGVTENAILHPAAISLSQNYPNPFNPSTSIRFTLPGSQHVVLTIYDPLGREVETLVNEDLEEGTHIFQWRPGRSASGTYFYRLQAGQYSETKKLVYIR